MERSQRSPAALVGVEVRRPTTVLLVWAWPCGGGGRGTLALVGRVIPSLNSGVRGQRSEAAAACGCVWYLM